MALEVLYDGQRVPLEIRDGKAAVREPQEGQKVTLVLRKIDATPDRYGVVLMVNGENTLYRERQSPLELPEVDLEPAGPGDHGPRVPGRRGDGRGVPGAVAGRVGEGRDGLRLRRGDDQPGGLPRGERRGRAPGAGRGGGGPGGGVAAAFPAKPPENLSALRHQLHQGSINRGLIVQGQQIGAAIRRVEFRPDPTPVMSATITYYRP